MIALHNLEALAHHFAHQAHAMERELGGAMRRIGDRVVETARSEFGNYQPAVGRFAGWSPLADYTMTERVRLGFTPDDPLLRTGSLRDSITYEIRGGGWDARNFVLTVGSRDPIMAYQEYGTMRIPPRPVVGPAVEREMNYIHQELGGAAIRGILGLGGGATVPYLSQI